MYCSECGMENGDTAAVCRLCRADLKTAESFVPEKIYFDITRVPFQRIIKNAIKTEGWGKTLLNLPLFGIIYFIRKISRTPWPGPMFNSRNSHYKPIRLESIKNLDKKKFQMVTAFLAEQGYQYLMDYELVGLAQDNLFRLMLNPHDKTHAVVAVSGARGSIRHVSFIGVWKNFYYSLTNGYGLPVAMGSNVKERYEGGFSLEKAHQAFLEDAAEIDGRRGTRKKVRLANLFRIFRRIHQFNIRQGIDQGLYISEKDPGRAAGTGAVGTSACYHHPAVVAVRTCTDCSHPLCESCARMVDGKVYCETCRPRVEAADGARRAPAGSPGPYDAGRVPGPAYAGFGIRLAAFIVDILLIGLLAYGAVLGGGRLLRVVGFNYLGPLILLGLVIGGVFTICYFVLLFQKSGRTLGHRVFGLKVVDETGRTLDIRAAVIRFGYYLISLIFIFPLIGFLAALFDRKKQGWHDRLAGTFVVGQKSWPRTIGAFVLILGLSVSAGWGMLQTMPGQFLQVLIGLKDTTPLRQAMAERDPQLFVKPVWTYGEEDGFIAGNWGGPEERTLTVISQQGLAGLDLKNGKIMWTNQELMKDWAPFGEAYAHDTPLLMVHGNDDFLPDRFAAVDRETGRIIWKNNLYLKKRQVTDAMEMYGVYDDQVIVVADEKSLTSYRLADGGFLWETDFEKECFLLEIGLNQGVILNLTCESAGTTRFMDEMKGNTLWERANGHPGSTFKLAEGYQLIRSDQGILSLMDLAEKRVIWKTGRPVGHILQERNDLRKRNEIPESLAIGNAVIDMSSGKIIFALPESYQSIGLSDQYGLFYNLRETIGQKGKNALLIVVDKKSGQKIGEFPFPVRGMMKYAGEDAEHLYLFFDKALFGLGFVRTNFFITIDKTSLTLEIGKLGKDYRMDFFEYLPEEGKLFISGEGRVGLYERPAPEPGDPAAIMGDGKTE